MPFFFMAKDGRGAVGRAIAVQDPHTEGTLSLLTLDPTLTWDTHKTIITRVSTSESGNFNALHTIGNDFYVYVFGDRIGQITISGLALSENCAVNDGVHGIEKVTEWYRQNKLANRLEPVVISIGRTPIEGFLIGCTSDIVDPGTRIASFNLSLMAPPILTVPRNLAPEIPELPGGGGGGGGGRGANGAGGFGPPRLF